MASEVMLVTWFYDPVEDRERGRQRTHASRF